MCMLLLIYETCTMFISRSYQHLSIYDSADTSLRSITMTLMLSELFRAKASRVSSAAANTLLDGYNASAPSSSICGLAFSVDLWPLLFSSPRHLEATSQAKSFDRTSHSPSLARIKHSSSGSLLVKVISGSDVTTGLRYLSPV